MTAQAADKFSRYRARQRERGLRQVRLWLPDPQAPGFREEIARQAALLSEAPEEAEVMAFVEAAWADLAPELDAAEDADRPSGA